ncbi:MAG: family 43 glycosylhydrolase, partial [Draconibacterium sp.]|nr:family 43 glycosylhydrolase [Draconibacterium sp.]
NGEYYLIGTGTSGQVYISSDLINWRGPKHVFSMKNNWTIGETAKDHQIHACDLNYINGIFHLYWSVNHRGDPYTTRRIGHATSKNVFGPYVEPVKNTWFDESIDAHLFTDKDGSSYFYSVRFTDGNTIWGSKLVDPWQKEDNPKMLLTASPMTWEYKDSKVIEGQFVSHYRDKYYMLYNANHTGGQWGNYGIGCAVANHPLNFNNANKYSYPLIQSNNDRILENTKSILPTGRDGIQEWAYTTTSQPQNWLEENFNDKNWQRGVTGFGSPKDNTSSTRMIQTNWKTSDIWIRCTFQLNEIPSEFVQLQIAYYEGTEVYLNGEKIYEGLHVPYYANLDILDKNHSLFKKGENTIAVHSIKTQDSNPQYIDLGLIDPQTEPGEESIFNPGQPSLVKGLNGFEWWLVYFAVFNSERRSQAADRVYFFDKKMFIDGLTSARTPGYHPNPAKPAFGDIFDRENKTDLGEEWNIKSGSWSISDGEAKQVLSANKSEAWINCDEASNFLFEVNLKFTAKTGDKIGVIAYQTDEQNYLKILFNQQNKKWEFILNEKGKLKTSSFQLPEDFNYNVYHNLSVTKNSTDFEIKIDNLPAPEKSTIHTSFSEKGKQGIYTESATAAFDGIIYTMGWDEFDTNITGWGNSFNGDKSSENWVVSKRGITPIENNSESKIFKGDLLANYEIMSQLTSDENKLLADKERKMGIYPVYVDSMNWLRADIDMNKNQLLVYGKKDGKTFKSISRELKQRRQIYPSISYSDRYTKTYKFDKKLKLSGLEIVLKKAESRDKLSSLRFFYKKEGWWEPVEFTIEKVENSFNYKLKFNTLFTGALRIKEEKGDAIPEINALYADIESKPDYNLRAVKLAEKVILFVDGKEIINIEGSWPLSQVGLVTNMECSYNGITFFGF